MRIEVQVFAGCPHAGAALALATDVAARLAPDAVVARVEVDTPARAAAVGFLGSPSIRVDGRDIEDRATADGLLGCRTYEDGRGVPPAWLMEAAVLRAVRPRGVLFLCVANSARSQLAEGIARALAPAGVAVWSAGSRPAGVRPEAAAVLREIGIDISAQRSRDVAGIPADEVDTVITLCAEAECPVFLGRARRLHWGLPDPAAAGGAEAARLAAFRQVRDELRRRLAVVFAVSPSTSSP
ncbi:MAG: arsenate reductase ArsC [Candidatus Krumholzibacteriia bacterium]